MKSILTDNQIKALRLRETHMRQWATVQLFSRENAGLADVRPNRHTRRALAKMGRVLRRFTPPRPVQPVEGT